MAKGGWVYVLASRPRGVIYIGVTGDLLGRMARHALGEGSAFCRRYGISTLVHVERFEDITEAIRREKAMKAWKRAWKVELIERDNPRWEDLSAAWFAGGGG